MSNVWLELEVDPVDADANHSTGLTSDAYERLTEALTAADFVITEGPQRVPE